MRLLRWTIPAAGLLTLSGPAAAQTRGFLVRLAHDTIAVERVSRAGATITGSVARHTPTTTVLKYSATLNPDGTVATYREDILHADGTPVPPGPNGVAQIGMTMTFAGDSVTRSVTKNNAPFSIRNAAPAGTLPYMSGGSPWFQEAAIQAAKRRGAADIAFYTFTLTQDSATRIPIRIIGADSAEANIGGFVRGYRFDAAGRLTRGDASRTTVKLLITPIAEPDIQSIAARWAAADASGAGLGVLSTRDTLRFSAGTATVSIDYGRPAARGRKIWGGLVPLDTVWRFGANAAATLITDRDLDIGGTRVPAGSYTLWLLPSVRSQSYLIVNRQTGQWGTMYDPAQDLVRIPIQPRAVRSGKPERFVVGFQADTLTMLWDDGGYAVVVRSP